MVWHPLHRGQAWWEVSKDLRELAQDLLSTWVFWLLIYVSSLKISFMDEPITKLSTPV